VPVRAQALCLIKGATSGKRSAKRNKSKQATGVGDYEDLAGYLRCGLVVCFSSSQLRFFEQWLYIGRLSSVAPRLEGTESCLLRKHNAERANVRGPPRRSLRFDVSLHQ